MKFSKWVVPMAVLSLGLSACGGKDSGEAPGGGDDSTTTDTAITISGTLATSARLRTSSLTPMSVDLDTLSMRCVTFSVPPTAGVGDIDATGKFSFKLADAKGSKFGCFVLDESEEVLASMVFEDSTEKDMSGENKTSSSIALSGDTNFGNVTLDLESGKAVVDKDQITTVTEDKTGSGYWDVTGTWTFASMGSELPEGYDDVCPNVSGPSDCNGPHDGESVFFKHIKGVKTGTTEPRYGLMVWRDQASYTACGSRLGTTFADLSSQGVDFTGASIGEGAFIWNSTGLGDGGTLTEGWKSSAAQTDWDWAVGCGNADYSGDQGFRCYDGTNNTYRMEFGGGCRVASTSEPIQINDWSSLTGVTYTSSSSTHHSGFQVSTMTGTYTYSRGERTTSRVICENEWALSGVSTFTTINNSLTFDWNNVTKVSSGTACSNAAFNSYPLERLKCYAQHYQHYSHEASGCFPDIRTNWAATNAADFVEVSYKTNAMYAANFFDLDAKGVGTFHDEHEDYRGAKSGNSWVNCRIRDGFTITLTPRNKSGETATSAIMEFASETILLDGDNGACTAFFKDQLHGEKKTIAGNTFWVSRMRSMSNMTKN